MSASWMKKKAELEQANSPEVPLPEKPFGSSYAPPPPESKNGQLSPLEWNFEEVPSSELWSCLIWEYGRSAGWVHIVLPQYGDVRDKIGDQIGRFHCGNPPKALKILNKMRLCQWSWSNEIGISNIEFFPQVPWTQLPAIVRNNMRRAVFGLEPRVDLAALDKIFRNKRATKGSDEVRAAEILKELFKFKSPPDTEEEKNFVSESLHWLPGGNGLDDVSDGVIAGESFLQRLQEGMGKFLRGELAINEAQVLLEATKAGEISIRQLRTDRILLDQGFFAVAFRLNWNLKKGELLDKFAHWIDDQCPEKFRSKTSGSKIAMRGPAGLELSVDPRTALNALGVWRRKTLLKGGWKRYFKEYDPGYLNDTFNYKSAQVEGSNSVKLVKTTFDYLFPARKKK